DVACLLLGSGLVTRISVDHDHFPSQTVPGAPVAMRAVTVRRTRQSLMRAVIGERMNGWTVILTWPSDRQQPPWNGTAGPVAGGCGHRGCAYTGAMDEEVTVTVNDIPEGATIVDVRED